MPQIEGFYFCTKFFNSTNSRALISNMSIVFKIASKTIKSGFFDSKFKDFYFCKKLYVFTNSMVLISSMTIRCSGLNLQIRHIWSQIWSFLCCRKRCILTNSSLLISNYDNNIFSNSWLKRPKRDFSGSKFEFFCFAQNLLNIWKIQERWRQIRQRFFKFQLKNTQQRHFVSILQFFCFG